MTTVARQYHTASSKAILVLCAFVVLFQLVAVAWGVHYDHHHDGSGHSEVSIALSGGENSIHDCGGHAHCHGGCVTVAVDTSSAGFSSEPLSTIATPLNASAPWPPIYSLFKPPIA